MVKVNGKMSDIVGKTVSEYIRSKNYNLNRIATELNGKILPKSKYENTVLKSGDTLEIVNFVGGG